jgi:hypothetical protein
MTKQERRQSTRLHLALPVRVIGHETSGAYWEEMTSVRDASSHGVCLALHHVVRQGQVLLLSLPLPKRLRRYDEAESSYRIYGLVRGVSQDDGAARVGVMFLGRHPPRGFERNPGGLFLLPSDPPPKAAERRKHPRTEVYVNLRIRRQQEGEGPREEQTIAENISRGGARVLTSMTVARGEIIEVTEIGGSFRTRAEVRNVYVGSDHIPRLNLHFLDAEPPGHLVPSS